MRRGRITAGMSRCSRARDGLDTLPTAAGGGRTFTLALDLCRHAIVLWVSDGRREELPLNAGSIAALHARLSRCSSGTGCRPLSTACRTRSKMRCRSPRTRRRRAYDRNSAERLREALARDAPGVRALPRRLFRQGEPGAFLVGRVRSRREPLLGPHGAAASGRHPRPARPDRARSLQRRSLQRRLLGRRSDRRPSPSSTAISTPSRTAFAHAKLAHGRIRRAISASSSCPMPRCEQSADPERMLIELPPVDLRGRRRPREVGSRRRWSGEPVGCPSPARTDRAKWSSGSPRPPASAQPGPSRGMRIARRGQIAQAGPTGVSRACSSDRVRRHKQFAPACLTSQPRPIASKASSRRSGRIGRSIVRLMVKKRWPSGVSISWRMVWPGVWNAAWRCQRGQVPPKCEKGKFSPA